MGLSPRLLRVVDALPLRPGSRVLEIGGAPGAAAREVARRVGPGGHVLVLDRSATGTDATLRACAREVAAGTVTVRCAAIEDPALQREPWDPPFDVAFACRVGALDGRHPALLEQALRTVARMLAPDGVLLVDTGDPLRELPLPR